MSLSDLPADERERLSDDLSDEYDAIRAQGLSLDLTRGKPSAEQLALADRLLELPDSGDVTSGSTDLRNYGGAKGIPELREIFGELLGVGVDDLLALDNSSLSVMYDLVSSAVMFGTNDSERPWKDEPTLKWLCPVPGYDRHFSITEAFGFQMVPVPLLDGGPDMDEVERLVADPAVKGMWTVPLFSNPTGVTYDDAVVSRLARMETAAPDFRVVWDNAYAIHTLTSDFPKVPDVLSLAEEAGHPNRFWQVASTSKVTFAGAGVAFLSSSQANLDWYLGFAGLRSIGPNKINQAAHARFFGDAEGVRQHMQRHRDVIAPKFDKAREVLDARLGGHGIARWTHPEGGYFIDLEVPDGTATEVVRIAGELGVALTPAGAAFPYGEDPNDRHIRLAPTMPAIDDVAAAVNVVALCTLMAADRRT